MIPQTPPWNLRGMGDPEKWGMPLRSKLCYPLGFAQGLVSEAACEHPDIGRSSDSEIVDSIIRMLEADGNLRSRA